MKAVLCTAVAAMSLMVCSCTTPTIPQAYHAADSNALVIESINGRTGRILQPLPSTDMANEVILEKARTMTQRQTVVIILQNYTEAQIGDQFRDRATPWFISLRSIGYDHIVFLQGNGNNNPEGLIELARYD